MNQSSSKIMLKEDNENTTSHIIMQTNSSTMISKSSYEMNKLPDEPSKGSKSMNASSNAQTDSLALAHEIQYVTDDNEQTMTFVYPQGALSLLPSNAQELVSLNEIPNVEVSENLELNNSLEYEDSVVLQNNFENEGRITVMTTSANEGQLRLLEDHNAAHNNGNSVSYIQSGDVESMSVNSNETENTVLSRQVITIPTSDVTSRGNTITLPISFINDSGEVSLLHDLSQLPISLGDTNHGDELSMPIIIEPNYIVANEDGSENQDYKITSIPSSIIADRESPSSPLDDQVTLDLSVKKLKNIDTFQSKVIKPFGGQVGRPPKDKRKRFIGTGASAISAQGIIKEVNNRLVTVLPRPEDLRKLIDSKQLVLSFKNNSLPKGHSKVKLNSKTLAIKEHLNTNQIETSSEDKTLLHEENELTKSRYLDEDYSPNRTSLSRYNGKKRKRGRPKDTYVVSSTKKAGRPRKVTTLIEGPKGPKFIHTGPSTLKSEAEESSSNINSEEIFQKDLSLKLEEIDLPSVKTDDNFEKRRLPPRNRGAKYKKMIEALTRNDYDDDDFMESSDDEISVNDNYSLKVSPQKISSVNAKGKRGRPRKEVPGSYCGNEGTQIIKLNESLKPIESTNTSSMLIHDDDDEATAQGDEKMQNKLVITFEHANTGEVLMQPVSIHASGEMETTNDSTTNITLVEANQNYIEEGTATILVTEDGKYKQSYQCDICEETTDSKQNYLIHLRSKHNLLPHECSYCVKTFLSKMALEEHSVTHFVDKRCDVCNMDFHSLVSLKVHIADQHPSHYSNFNAMEEEAPFKCSTCSETFSSQDSLNNHSSCAFKNKYFICDLCNLKFLTSSGLNRHRKVHDRAKNSETQHDNFRCVTCHSSFTFENSLLKHIQTVHQGVIDTIDSSSYKAKEQKVIEQLQSKLNEGYAPKTAELYDVPEGEEATDEGKAPFYCGICNESFKDIDLLCDHYAASHTGEQEIYCDFCSVGCSTKTQLEKHKLIHQQEEKLVCSKPKNGLAFPCKDCGRRLRSTAELEKHKKSHLKRFKCSFCPTSFPIRSALDKHLLVHTGQRPFACDICLKSFRQSAALVRHKLWTHRLKNQNKCEICGKTFFTYNLLVNHLEVHGEPGKQVIQQLSLKPIKEDSSSNDVIPSPHSDPQSKICEYCGKQCASIVALLSHKITHKLHASFKCDQCHRTFREKKYLRKHKLTHKGVKIWKCDICYKTFATKLTLIRHSHVHLREAFLPEPEFSSIDDDDSSAAATSSSTLPSDLKCEACNIDFDHKTHYVRHKLLHSGIPLLKCGICDKLFVHKSDIIRHKVMHSFMFTCDICGRNFHKRSLFLLHKKKHLDAKPFKCEHCGKGFATSGNHKTHLRIHNGEKPFQCGLCDYRCSQSGRLLKHKRMHTGEKICFCNICGKRFANAESHKVHQRVHTGERPFKCDQCPRTFINNTSLNQHLREHLKEQIYKCEKCTHKFRRPIHLERHMMFHNLQQLYIENKEMGIEGDANAENPLYMCEICGRVFEKKKYLYTHLNVHSRQRMFSCSVCEKQLASRLAHKNHMMIHSGEMPHKCGLCEKEFRNLSNLKRHEKSHTSQEMLNCEQCGETFYNSNLLADHKQNHMNLILINPQVENVECSVNSQLYVFDEAVDGGMSEAMDTTQRLLVTSSQQQFLVENSQPLLTFPETVAESFDIDQSVNETNEDIAPSPPPPPIKSMSPEDIKEEELTVSPSILVVQEVDKPYQCDVCSKNFAKKQYLTKHKYRHRVIKPHACDICGKRFAQKFEVAVHKIKHSGLKPYPCNICNKEFRSKVNLINHKMRHTGDYPYLCSVCNKGLSTQLQLEKHVSLHTGAHPYRCHICSKGYFQQLSLIRHINKAHVADVASLDGIQSMGNEVEEQMEVIEAISNIEGLEKHSLGELVEKKPKVEEINALGDEMEMDDLNDSQFVQPEYLKNCLLDSQHQDISSKFFNVIFQSDRAEDEDR